MSLSSLVLGVFWYLVFSQLLLYAYLLRLVFLCFRCVLLSHVSVSPHNFPGQGRNIMTTTVHLLLVSLSVSLVSLYFQKKKIPSLNFLPKFLQCPHL